MNEREKTHNIVLCTMKNFTSQKSSSYWQYVIIVLRIICVRCITEPDPSPKDHMTPTPKPEPNHPEKRFKPGPPLAKCFRPAPRLVLGTYQNHPTRNKHRPNPPAAKRLTTATHENRAAHRRQAHEAAIQRDTWHSHCTNSTSKAQRYSGHIFCTLAYYTGLRCVIKMNLF